MWHCDTEVQADSTVHVWPDTDIISHDLHGAACVCGPTVDVEGSNFLVTHHRLVPDSDTCRAYIARCLP